MPLPPPVVSIDHPARAGTLICGARRRRPSTHLCDVVLGGHLRRDARIRVAVAELQARHAALARLADEERLALLTPVTLRYRDTTAQLERFGFSGSGLLAQTVQLRFSGSRSMSPVQVKGSGSVIQAP